MYEPPAGFISTTLQAENDIIITRDEERRVKVWNISTGHYKGPFETPEIDSNSKDIWLVDRRLIFVWYSHKGEGLMVLDLEKQELLFKKKLDSTPSKLRISEDGSKIIFQDETSIQTCSMWTGEATNRIMAGDSTSSGKLILDGSRVWEYHKLEYQGWEMGNLGSSPTLLPKTPPSKLHPSGAMLWDFFLSRVQNIATGKIVFQLAKGLGIAEDVQWYDNHLFICFKPRKVFVLDCRHILPQ